MITVLGASGFVGSALVVKLLNQGRQVYAPERDDLLTNKPLGHVIYSIGLTADFRHRPYDTIEAHICKLKHLLENGVFESFTYLSSTRIYSHNREQSVDEKVLIPVDVLDPFDLFNSSKLAGESLTLNCGRKNMKVARLSNVYGNDFKSENFITAIIKEAVKNNKVLLRTTLNSSKDYISLNDVTDLLIKIATKEESDVYNVASGINTNNEDILKELQRITNCNLEIAKNAKQIVFPTIDNSKIRKSFDYVPDSTILSDLAQLVNNLK